MTTATKPNDLASMTARLDELQAEAAKLEERRRIASNRLAGHVTKGEREAIARRLIAGEQPSAVDASHELEEVTALLTHNRLAREILNDAIRTEQIKAAHRAAAPLFEKAMGHLPKLAKALAELERAVAEADRDFDAWEAVDPGVTSVSAPYDRSDLSLIRAWRAGLVNDEPNLSKLDHWRQECRERGYRL